MHIIIAPDSFKGSLSAAGVANAMERGLSKVFPKAKIYKLPIADGGEGTVEALVMATKGSLVTQQVMGPLQEDIDACFGLLGDGKTAVIEMASASGLPLVPIKRRDPRYTTTYGTGQLIKAALDKGIRKLIIGIGGSATNDGGAGMAQALGVQFLDKDGVELKFGGIHLSQLKQINCRGIDPRLLETEILVACDVENPLCGANGASAVYGPQKGATDDMVKELDDALFHFSRVADQATGKAVAMLPGAGAAGGLGAGLLYFTNAQLRPGIEIILNTMEFEKLLPGAAFILTGEGCTDYQTAFGKAPVGIAKLANKYNVPTICLSGGLGKEYQAVYNEGIAAAASMVSGPLALEECMARAGELLEDGTERLGRLLKIGSSIK
jgi:glycerate kinase